MLMAFFSDSCDDHMTMIRYFHDNDAEEMAECVRNGHCPCTDPAEVIG